MFQSFYFASQFDFLWRWNSFFYDKETEADGGDGGVDANWVDDFLDGGGGETTDTAEEEGSSSFSNFLFVGGFRGFIFFFSLLGKSKMEGIAEGFKCGFSSAILET